MALVRLYRDGGAVDVSPPEMQLPSHRPIHGKACRLLVPFPPVDPSRSCRVPVLLLFAPNPLSIHLFILFYFYFFILPVLSGYIPSRGNEPFLGYDLLFGRPIRQDFSTSLLGISN